MPLSELIRSTPNETGNRSGHPRPVLTDVILYDAEFSGSEIGGFVSLSELSPPGRSNARKYAINHEGVNFPKVPIRQVAPSGRNLLTSPPGSDQQPDGPLLRSSTFNVLQRTGHFTSGRLTWSVVAGTGGAPLNALDWREIGAIKVGKTADRVLVDGDPTSRCASAASV